jgi:hypothetical protein
VRINQPIPESVFDLKFHPGIYIDNGIEGKKYKVDANGTPIGPKTDIAGWTSVPDAPKLPEPRYETKTEPRPWGYWTLRVSAGILALGCILHVVRRRRATRLTEQAPAS